MDGVETYSAAAYTFNSKTGSLRESLTEPYKTSSGDVRNTVGGHRGGSSGNNNKKRLFGIFPKRKSKNHKGGSRGLQSTPEQYPNSGDDVGEKHMNAPSNVEQDCRKKIVRSLDPIKNKYKTTELLQGNQNTVFVKDKKTGKTIVKGSTNTSLTINGSMNRYNGCYAPTGSLRKRMSSPTINYYAAAAAANSDFQFSSSMIGPSISNSSSVQQQQHYRPSILSSLEVSSVPETNNQETTANRNLKNDIIDELQVGQHSTDKYNVYANSFGDKETEDNKLKEGIGSNSKTKKLLSIMKKNKSLSSLKSDNGGENITDSAATRVRTGDGDDAGFDRYKSKAELRMPARKSKFVSSAIELHGCEKGHSYNNSNTRQRYNIGVSRRHSMADLPSSGVPSMVGSSLNENNDLSRLSTASGIIKYNRYENLKLHKKNKFNSQPNRESNKPKQKEMKSSQSLQVLRSSMRSYGQSFTILSEQQRQQQLQESNNNDGSGNTTPHLSHTQSLLYLHLDSRASTISGLSSSSSTTNTNTAINSTDPMYYKPPTPVDPMDTSGTTLDRMMLRSSTLPINCNSNNKNSLISLQRQRRKKRDPQKNGLKIGVLGDVKVGKSCLVSRIMFNIFCEIHKPSTDTKHVKLLKNRNGEQFLTEIVDFAGHTFTLGNFELNPDMIFILVFSTIDKNSFEKLKETMNRMKQQNLDFIVVGSKSDLIEKRQVAPTANIKRTIFHQYNTVYFEVTAKNQRCNRIFYCAIRHFV